VRHPLPEARHTVAQMMSLLAAEGLEPVYDMRLYAGEPDRAWWRERRGESGATGRYAVLAPTARWPSKRWPAACWAAIVGPLVERGYDRVFLVGAPSERDQVEPVLEACDRRVAVSLAGQATIGQTMAVIADADLVIANDSAPLHMAVGFDRACLGLFGPTDPEEVGPFNRPEAVIRRFQPASERSVNYKDARLGSALMAMILPADVLERVDRLLAQRGRVGDGAEALPRRLNGDAARHARKARS
jgi:ADP-heptose:LPS heptosyltransferase